MKTTLPKYQIDTFTNKVFKGNPAAVVPLKTWLPDDVMQSIAAENNLAETAFFVKTGENYHIRWFTPSVEVDLCGHATLASAFVLFEKMKIAVSKVLFSSKSGPLGVTKIADRLELDFPAYRVKACEASKELLEAVAAPISEVCESGSGTYIVVLESEAAVQNFVPDFAKLSRVDRCVNITAKGSKHDFVSRFFGPNIGIPEDPVTGSVHCGLAVYWGEKLRKVEMTALQLSQRTGELRCVLSGDRVLISGQAVLYAEGQITI